MVSEPKGKSRDIKALSFITMELMQKYVKEDGVVGVDNLHRWPSDSNALGFLSATTSIISIEELLKVYLLILPPFRRPALITVASTSQPSVPEV